MRETTPLAEAQEVLVVGGDAPTQAMLHFLLADIGCKVREAGTVTPATDPGAVALVAIILDAPGAALNKTFATLRQRGYCCPIVVLMREASRRFCRRAFALGAVDVVSLPAAPAALQARLRAALEDGARVSLGA